MFTLLDPGRREYALPRRGWRGAVGIKPGALHGEAIV